MKGNEVDICFSDMRRWTPEADQGKAMRVTALGNGDISLNGVLRRKIAERGADSWNMEIYATEDMRILTLCPAQESNFKFPKNGRRKMKSYIDELHQKGYKIPAIYNVEWNDKSKAWVGILQEVSECPKVVGRRRKNGK